MEKDIDTSVSLISRIHSSTADFLSSELAKKGLKNFSSSHGNILFHLTQNTTLPMKELAEKINRDKSTTTVLARKLEKDGLVKTLSSKDDKRKKLITLTAKGKKYTEITSELSKTLLKTFYANFTKNEKELFFTLLSKIADNFSINNT